MEEFNMTLNKYLDIAPEVQKALDEGRPVVLWNPPSSLTVCPILRMWRLP